MSEEALDLRALKAAAEKISDDSKSKKPLTPREQQYSIQVPNRDTGEMRRCVFTSRVMDGNQRATVARMTAAMVGVPCDQVPNLLMARLYQLAVCTVQITDAPDWLLNSMAEEDVVLGKIFSTLEGHSAAYFRRDIGAGEAEEAECGVVISPYSGRE